MSRSPTATTPPIIADDDLAKLRAENERLRALSRRLRGRLVSVCQGNDLMTDEDAEAIADADELLAARIFGDGPRRI